MAEVRIGVGANADNVAKAVEKVTAAINKMGAAVAAASGIKFEPVDVKYAERDLGTINKQFEQAIKQSAVLRNAIKNSGQQGKSFAQVDWSKTNIDPKLAQKMRDRAFRFSTEGTAWDMTNFDAEARGPGGRRPDGGRYWGARREREPESTGRKIGTVVGKAAGGFASGVGGLGGKVAGGAIDGAGAGAADGGGLLGGMGGLLKGAGVAALVGGLLEAGKMLSQGVDMAKQRDIGVDGLKRQMGDLGISFDELRDMSDKASAGLGMNAAEFAQLEATQQNAAHGGYRSPLELASAAQQSAGFARSYGMDPGQSAAFFGGMRNIRDPRVNNKELAMMIAEAIQRVGGGAMASDVMQAALGFSSATSRNSLSSVGVDHYLGGFGSMMKDGGPGMTSDSAGMILGQANASMMNMGGAGEAGQNFMLQAFNKQGTLNPVEARALAAGGLFGDRDGVFSENTALGKYMLANGQGDELKRVRGSDGEVNNFMSVKSKLNSDEQNPWMRLDAAQRLYGLNSPQQAAALMSLDGKGYGNLQQTLEGAGVNMKDLNESGIQTLASIGGASSMGDLSKIYGQIKGRTGSSALSDDERKQLDTAQSTGNASDFKSALARIMASKDQEETEGSDIRKGNASLENIRIAIGEKLVPAMNTARDALLSIAGRNGKSASPEELARAASDAADGVNQGGSSDDTPLKHWWNSMETSRSDADKGIAPYGKQKLAALGMLAGLDKQYGIPAGGLEGIWGAESSFGVNTGESSAGALGNFQQMPDTIKRYGIKTGDFNSEASGAAKQIADLMKADGGDFNKALAAYGGFVTKDPSSYINKVHAYGDMSAKGKASDADDFGSIITLPPEKTPKSKDKTEKSDAGDGRGSVDTVMLDVNVNLAQPNGAGGTTVHQISTSVPVPRGSGVRQASISN
ncbi:hypothetical protein [Paraburkholderia sediminicola]|uniref:hypothetical protein n=1 Tax=Paraburkholderia sediminicola TaxID=458836 RepID=UPI0038BC4BF5